jgi:molybdopterin synthase sulfur carrier subunit
MIQILYFASLRERLGTASETIESPDAGTTVADIAATLRSRGAPWDDVLGEDQTILVAVNQEMAALDKQVQDGDEVAFFPPVTGG